ncbi:MAG: 50S ribosomal protein L9 [Chlamydiae bacterium RIFCSPHIGHO2_12_FULL_49_9]|nr:MAG: 50S ribosomal protein L9 [Chlamydiae bacterium RIFCSPHIGHO2_12_FULL_49_9]
MKQQLLLLEDVEALGKKGEVVSARPGYTRNFLLPKGFAVIANANMLRKQERLRAEREKQAVVDKQEAEALARQIESAVVETKVKVDPDGHMYGSVSAADIALLFQERGIPVERKNVLLSRPIKQIGAHKISFKLKEGVLASCDVTISAEGGIAPSAAAVVAPLPTEEKPEEEKSE